MLVLEDIVHFLDRYFVVQRFEADQGGVYRSSARPIHRIGLALEPWPELSTWVQAEDLDALFLHRPWKVHPDQLPLDVGVVAYHLAFDERLTLGLNPRLADVLGMIDVEVLGHKDGRPIGMIGTVPSQSFVAFQRHCSDVFGGYEQTVLAQHEFVTCIAVVGAMTDALVREASARDAAVYVTGQYRHPACAAVAATGIGVIEVGHRRSEAWGLRALAGVLRERWATLAVVLPHNDR